VTHSIVSAFDALAITLCDAFQARSAKNFLTIVRGFVLCLGRPTVTNLARVTGEPSPERPSRLHRFFSRAVWDPTELARLLVVRVLVPIFVPSGPVTIAADETTMAKFGRRVAFASHYLDALASSRVDVVHWSHNWLIVCLIVACPWARERRLHIPIYARLHIAKRHATPERPSRTPNELLVEAATTIASWLDRRRVVLLADGAYAAGDVLDGLPARVTLVSRIRRNAALYEPPPVPARRGRYGRPRVKGERLPTLERIAETAHYHEVEVWMYGRRRTMLAASLAAVWYPTSKRVLRIVISRDPEGKHADEYFFTTERDAEAEWVIEGYAERWGVEEAIRELKQSLGVDEVQSWSAKAVERQVPTVLVVHALVMAATYSRECPPTASTKPMSFARTLTRLRMEIWSERLSAACAHTSTPEKILDQLERALLTAA
jgi:hypothetical protein